MKKLRFLMGIHCHQPVDNFESVFKSAYEKSYDPFLRVLAKHPKIKLSLHYSGPVLNWIATNRPDYIVRVRELIERGQVEILTGGYFEPIIPMIPIEDAKGQIRMLTHSIEKYFGYSPCGMWLAERVWSPGIVCIFTDLNLRYTIVDDFHLKQAHVKEGRLFGRYSIKGNGDFSIFASVKKLRYTMPFRSVEVTMDFLRSLYENPEADSVTFADDCEKFGFWPYTYDWVYRKGWLERFFVALEEKDWIKTLTFTEALGECKSLGEVDIPECSYAEMLEWCNGNFNNFFEKYPAANRMRNRMFYVSERIKDQKAKEELYKAQSNCAYWHGIFGGIYTNYLRHGVYRHIIKAENSIENGNPSQRIELIKFQDGTETVRLQNGVLSLFINPNYAGSIFEIDYKPIPYNIVDTLSRCYEPYHEKLKTRRKLDIASLRKKIDDDEPIDLYELLGVREKNLDKFLSYDSYQKFSCICHIMDLKTTFEDFVKSTHVNTCNNDFLGAFTYEVKDKNGRLITNLTKEGYIDMRGTHYRFRLNKCIILERDGEIFIRLVLENISSMPVGFIFGVEFNWSLEDKNFMKPRRQKRIERISLRDKTVGIGIEHVFKIPVELWSFPLYTLNESEKGLGKNFQEISLLFHRRVGLKKGREFSLEMNVKVSGWLSKKSSL